MKILPQTLALALLPCLLAACGGGGGDDNSVNSAVNSPRDGLSAQEKQAFEVSQVSSDTMNWSGDPEPFRLTVAGKTIQDATADAMRIDGRSLPAGFASLPGNFYFANTNDNDAATVRSYRGFRSGIFTARTHEEGVWASAGHYGVATRAEQIPASGKATYNGVAFDISDRGTLTYHVDFGAKQGEGQIQGLSRYGNITLHPAKIGNGNGNGAKIEGKASTVGKSMEYDARFFGYGAEEILGTVTNDDTVEYIGFHGTRGDIQ